MRRSRVHVPRSASNGHIVHRPNNGELGEFWGWATCEQVDCDAWRRGWEVVKSVVTETQYAAFRQLGYRYTVLDLPDDAGRLVFEAGQTCFDAHTVAAYWGHPRPAHRVLIDRDPVFYLRDGHRGSRLVGPSEWVDTFHADLDRVATLRARG